MSTIEKGIMRQAFIGQHWSVDDDYRDHDTGPDTLGQQLQRFQDRLPELLERGLREVMADRTDAFEDESAILALLASQPAPEQVLALHPTTELQERISDLLFRSREGMLSAQEATELDRYLLLEHLVRLAKAHAAKQLAQQA